MSATSATIANARTLTELKALETKVGGFQIPFKNRRRYLLEITARRAAIRSERSRKTA